jgi:hypothetical protein
MAFAYAFEGHLSSKGFRLQSALGFDIEVPFAFKVLLPFAFQGPFP